MLDMVRLNAGLGKRYLGEYFRQEDLKVFYARKVKSLFYIDSDKRNAVIFTDKLELKHFHVLQMMIPKYLPGLFTDHPLTELETKLLKSAGNKSATEYETLIEEFAKALDIRSEIIRIRLAGFETASERIRMDEIKNDITQCRQNYEIHLSTLRSVAQQIQEYQYLLAGLECSIKESSGDSELVEYFLCNKNLSVIKVQGTALEFIVHGYADIYDEEAFGLYVGNHSGYMYNRLHSSVTKNQMEKLYRTIFGEGQYKLRICAAYTADMRTGLVGRRGYIFPAESRMYLPNPHIQQYGCIGTYAGRFQEYMQRKDYVGAIDQAVVSARNLNFYDSAAMGTLSETLSGAATQCIETPDGTLLTPLEAILKLEGGDTECPDPS
jgi:hypothetical protein